MPKFDIYMIWGKAQDGNILRYYGSTSNFIKRKYNHKKHYEHWVKQGRPNNKKCSAFYILDNGDWKMEKIDEIIGDRWEAKKKEGEYQKNNECVNINTASRSKKEYYKDKKNKMDEYHYEWVNKNKDKMAIYKKKYYEKKKQDYIETVKKYYNNNKQAILEKKQEKYEKNKQAISEKRKKKYEKNKNEILEKRKEKIICECGTETTKNYIYKHRKTKKHINLISNNELNV